MAQGGVDGPWGGKSPPTGGPGPGGSQACWVPGLDFPRRPPWSFAMSPEELRAREEAAFSAFLRALREDQRPGEGEDGDGGDVAPFEHNLEVRGDVAGDTGVGGRCLGTRGSPRVPFPRRGGSSGGCWRCPMSSSSSPTLGIR